MRVTFFRSFLVALSAIAGATVGFGTLAARADTWPSHTVQIIVPYGPGAANDLNARLLATYLSGKYGQQFIVVNRPGGNGLLASKDASRAAPDGYTLLEHNNNISSIGEAGKVDFDPNRDLTPIGMISIAPNALVVPSSLHVTTVPELIAYGKAHPDNMFFGTGAYGAEQHLQHVQFAMATGITVKPIVYQSGAEIINDLVAGRTQLLFSSLSTAAGQIAAGKLVLLAYASEVNSPDLPKAPSLKSMGIDYETNQWQAIFGPPNMDAALRDKINADIRDAVQSPQFADFLKKAGAAPSTMTADQFAAAVKAETDEVNYLYKVTGIKPE